MYSIFFIASPEAIFRHIILGNLSWCAAPWEYLLIYIVKEYARYKLSSFLNYIYPCGTSH